MKTYFIAIGCVVVMGALPVANAAPEDQSRQDQIFVNEAARGGKMEVKLGQLAQQRAFHSEVKQFGARMITDHTRLNTELGSVATSIGLTVPTDLSSEQQAEYNRLSRLSGAKFDEAYMDLMAKNHTNDLAAFQKEETATQNQKLKKMIANAIPVIQEHLNMANGSLMKMGNRKRVF